VRCDERQHHRLHAPHEHGPTVREVVRCRALRRRDDETVAPERAGLTAVDRVVELDDAADRRARDHGVVHNRERVAPDLQLERRELDDRVVAAKDTRDALLELVGRDRRQEPDATEVHADHRHACSEIALQRAQHRAVAAQDDRNVGRCIRLDELDAAALGDDAHTRDCVLDEIWPAVHHDRGGLNRWHRRSPGRSRPEALRALAGRCEGRTHGCLSGPEGRSL
jgi:hypothetical protein